jgi:PadR family transcriptional regulator AphA
MSGYDIRKFVEEHIGYFWKESYGQIYPMLKRMAAQGLVEARTERNSGKPDRQVYSLTLAGHAEFQTWLGQPPLVPSPRNELLLKLFFGHRSEKEDLIRHVTEFRRRHEKLLQQYSRVEKWLRREHANHPGLPYWFIKMDYGRAIRAWRSTGATRRCALCNTWQSTATGKRQQGTEENKEVTSNVHLVAMRGHVAHRLKDTPAGRSTEIRSERESKMQSLPRLGGLHHCYAAAA